MSNVFSQLSWLGRHKLPVIHQNEAAECGLVCLAMVANYHGHKIDLATIRQRYTVSIRGVTLAKIIQIANSMGLNTRPLRLELEHISKIQLPAILHWDMNHFVVLKSVSKKSITIHDPEIGEHTYSLEEASKHMTGVALELSPSHEFQVKEDYIAKLRLTDMWTDSSGFKRVLLQALSLSVILQVFILLSPFYMQLSVDEVIMKQDHNLLLVLLVGFAILHLINIISETLRSYVLLSFGSLFSFQIVTNLFKHLIRLPMSFFEKRHVGDIMSRFSSTEPVKRLLTEDLVAGIVDGLMAITTLTMMFIYSASLTWVVVALLLIYAVINFVLIGNYRNRTQETITTHAAETSNFLETMRSMQTIKLYGKEQDREHLWQNRYAEVINANFKLGKITITFAFFKTLTTSIEALLVIYLGVKLVLQADMTIGMLFAFIAYKTQFSDKLLSLLQKGMDLKMLSLHLQRLADIVHTPKEKDLQGSSAEHMTKLSGAVEINNLTFRYSSDEPYIFSGLNIVIKPGEIIAIIGPSGCGKTTLLKVMTGLLQADQGEIKLDGFSLNTNISIKEYRNQIAVVMQDDQLLSGSINDNICFFDNHPDFEHARACAELACIHQDIMQMPMNYQTLIGDMGSFLSGGQKQRLLLARALYRQPRILFMDEGTSHLDISMERQVNRNIEQLKMTRIIIAHRPDTIKTADRVYDLSNKAFIQSFKSKVIT